MGFVEQEDENIRVNIMMIADSGIMLGSWLFIFAWYILSTIDGQTEVGIR